MVLLLTLKRLKTDHAFMQGDSQCCLPAGRLAKTLYRSSYANPGCLNISLEKLQVVFI